MDNCKETNYKFISSQIELFSLICDDIGIYLSICIFFGILNVIKHYVHVMAAQLHREAMSVNPDEKRRKLCKIIGIQTGTVLIHIIDILIISRSNFILLVIAFSSNLIGTSLVYKYHRKDHRHPLRSLAKSIEHYHSLKEHSDEKKELGIYIQYIQTFMRSEESKITNQQDIHF